MVSSRRDVLGCVRVVTVNGMAGLPRGTLSEATVCHTMTVRRIHPTFEGNRTVPTLPQDRLFAFARDLFQAGGVDADEAAVVARSLVDSNLAGHDSHGVI